jgi:hypothetical protein
MFQRILCFLSLYLLTVNLYGQDKPELTSLVVQRSGGGGGIQETYEFNADGKFKFSDLKNMHKGELQGDALKTLTEAILAIDWGTLPAKKMAEGKDRFLPDIYQYNVAIIVNKKFYTRTFQTPAVKEDKAMQTFMLELENLKQVK